jgi:hypothetical protein
MFYIKYRPLHVTGVSASLLLPVGKQDLYKRKNKGLFMYPFSIRL